MNFSSIRLRLRALLFRARVESEMKEELDFHVEMQTRKNHALGASGADAKRQALMKFGGVAWLEEECRDERRINVIDNVMQDIRYTIRAMRRSPGFTAVALISLVIGIGANTAVFTLINAVFLASLPVRDPGGVVLLGNASGSGNNVGQVGSFSLFSYDLYKHLRNSSVLDDLFGFQSSPDVRVSVRHLGAETARPVAVRVVSGNYFEALGVRAAVGRVLTGSDDSAGAATVAVVSYGYWKEKLGGDPTTIGSSVDVSGNPVSIIGIAPPEFYGDRLQANPPDFWFPLFTASKLTGNFDPTAFPNRHWLYVMGRLKPGMAVAQAEERLTGELRNWLVSQEGTEISVERQRDIANSYVELTPGGSGILHLRQNYSQTLWILLGISAVVLLITCANLANLLLARGTTRRAENAVRHALGAGRGRLVQQSLTESLTLALSGGALGLLVAWVGARLLVGLFFRGADYVPIPTSPDYRVLLFTLALSCGTAIVFGLLPAIRMNSDIAPAIKGSVWATRRKFGLGKALIVFEVALALVVLAGAGAFVRSLMNLANQQFGFNRDRVAIISVGPSQLPRYGNARLELLYRRLYSQLNALPGVASASLSFYSPFNGCCWFFSVSVQGYTPRPGESDGAMLNRVSPRYFETIGTRILAGRTFDERDALSAPRVAVVNEAFVRHYFPKESPIGKRFGIGGETRSGNLEIIGVVENTKYEDPRDELSRPMAFLPLFQLTAADQHTMSDGEWGSNFINAIAVRSTGNPAVVAAEARKVLTEIDPDLVVLRVDTLSDNVAATLRQDNVIADLAVFFGLLALVLACIGLYGLVAYMVQRRTDEIGIRIALGANRSAVIGMVIREATIQGLAGVVIGIPAAFSATQLIAGRLFGANAADSTNSLIAGLILIACLTVAAFLPAYRASRIDPMDALRHD